MAHDSSANRPLLTARKLKKKVLGPGGVLSILESVDIELIPGEATAILGASGSGKSTLLGLLAGLDKATGGEVVLFDQSLSALDEDGRAALRVGRVGFVFQSFQLLPGMSALENVMLPLELIADPDPRAKAQTALNLVKLSARLHHYPRQLSSGEQQRVAIARAFATRPRLMFADEPTGSLDQLTSRHISNLLFELCENSGAALLLVTHDNRLADRCDRRLLLENGRLTVAA
ncbi:MAG: ATP-binding cassette domain-containing protein [Gammaproteobacteria bacterium]|nr:ATP-binding cassette domain-containing protein [Gammaproteobacteria bacterium]